MHTLKEWVIYYKELSNICVTEDGQFIESDFDIFEKGDEVIEIWQYIDEKCPIGYMELSRLANCEYCENNNHNDMMPPHFASNNCESGKRHHCTCDKCF